MEAAEDKLRKAQNEVRLLLDCDVMTEEGEIWVHYDRRELRGKAETRPPGARIDIWLDDLQYAINRIEKISRACGELQANLDSR